MQLAHADLRGELAQRGGQPAVRHVHADLVHGPVVAPLPVGQVAGRGLLRAAVGAEQQVSGPARDQRQDEHDGGHHGYGSPSPLAAAAPEHAATPQWISLSCEQAPDRPQR